MQDKIVHPIHAIYMCMPGPSQEVWCAKFIWIEKNALKFEEYRNKGLQFTFIFMVIVYACRNNNWNSFKSFASVNFENVV